jgi:hypothetical protein
MTAALYTVGIPVPPIADLCHYISHLSAVAKTDHLSAMILSFIPLPIWFIHDSLPYIHGFLFVREDGHMFLQNDGRLLTQAQHHIPQENILTAV